MVEASYRVYQSQNSVPPPIPYKKPRPSSMMSYPPQSPPPPPSLNQLQQQQQSPHHASQQQYYQQQPQQQQHGGAGQQQYQQQYAPPPYTYEHTYTTTSDRLHPAFNSHHRRDTSTSSAGSFAMYQLQRELPAINTGAANTYGYSHGHPNTANSMSTPVSARFAPASATSSSAPGSQQQQQLLQDAYVATLRRQKATVWCERAQAEDPRTVAAQRAAKARAGAEIGISPSGYGGNGGGNGGDSHSLGGSSSGSPASSLYGGSSGNHHHHHHKASKILVAAGVVGVNTVKKKTWVKVPSSGSHMSAGGGSSKRIVLDPGSLIVGAVPTRLSATEVMGDSSDEDDGGYSPTGSGRRKGGKCINSNHRQSQREYERNNRRSMDVRDGNGGGLKHVSSTGSKSSQNSKSSSSYSKAVDGGAGGGAESDVLGMTGRVDGPIRPEDYFMNSSGNGGKSISRSSSLDGLGPLPAVVKPKSPTGPTAGLSASDLRRMGSVDEKDARTRTMSGVRLFVANPDA